MCWCGSELVSNAVIRHQNTVIMLRKMHGAMIYRGLSLLYCARYFVIQYEILTHIYCSVARVLLQVCSYTTG